MPRKQEAELAGTGVGKGPGSVRFTASPSHSQEQEEQSGQSVQVSSLLREIYFCCELGK